MSKEASNRKNEVLENEGQSESSTPVVMVSNDCLLSAAIAKPQTSLTPRPNKVMNLEEAIRKAFEAQKLLELAMEQMRNRMQDNERENQKTKTAVQHIEPQSPSVHDEETASSNSESEAESEKIVFVECPQDSLRGRGKRVCSRGRSRDRSRGHSRGHSRGRSRGSSRGRSRGNSRGRSHGHEHVHPHRHGHVQPHAPGHPHGHNHRHMWRKSSIHSPNHINSVNPCGNPGVECVGKIMHRHGEGKCPYKHYGKHHGKHGKHLKHFMGKQAPWIHRHKQLYAMHQHCTL